MTKLIEGQPAASETDTAGSARQFAREQAVKRSLFRKVLVSRLKLSGG